MSDVGRAKPSRARDAAERYQDLAVWNLAYDFALDAYRVTAQFPAEERFGLSQQIRRAAVAIVANLAEGKGRGSRKEFLHFCTIARGSQAELDALLLLSRGLGFLPEGEWAALSDRCKQIGRMLNRLVASLREQQ
jgi:four helix bundle protein